MEYQDMEEDQDGDGQERTVTPRNENGPIIGDDDGVIADSDDTEDKEEHERSESPQSGAELEHVPGHDDRRRPHHAFSFSLASPNRNK